MLKFIARFQKYLYSDFSGLESVLKRGDCNTTSHRNCLQRRFQTQFSTICDHEGNFTQLFHRVSINRSYCPHFMISIRNLDPESLVHELTPTSIWTGLEIDSERRRFSHRLGRSTLPHFPIESEIGYRIKYLDDDGNERGRGQDENGLEHSNWRMDKKKKKKNAWKKGTKSQD